MNDSTLGLAISLIPRMRGEKKLLLWEKVQENPRYAANFLRSQEKSLSWESLLSRAREIEKNLNPSIKMVTLAESSYPVLLRQIDDPPFLLFYRGQLPDNEKELIAVVGTRRASEEARHAAFRLCVGLGFEGVPVVSGLAFGIDAAAHQGNLAGKGETIAVLGSGLCNLYPKAHRRLAQQILDSGGALISEFLPDESPRKYHFPKRNRIISGLVQGVVLIEAPVCSGALITADFAIQQGRDLFVHSLHTDNSRGAGGGSLIEDGAIPIRGVEGIWNYWKRPYSRGEPHVISRGIGGSSLALSLKEELEGKIFPFKGRFYGYQ